MQPLIKLLLVEDLPEDAEMAEREIRKTLGPGEVLRVETRRAYLAALTTFRPDLIVSDFKLPQFDGLSALELAKAHAPDVPFIMLTGSMNEDTAVECMKAGAWDYVIKEHIKRLGSAARSALDLRQTQRDCQSAELSLRQSEQRLKVAQRLGRIGHWEIDLQTQKLHWSDAVFAIYGRDPRLGPPSLDEAANYYSPEVARDFRESAARTIETGEPFELNATLLLPEGRHVDIATIGSALTDQHGRVVRLLGTVQDVTERNRADARIKHLNSVLRAIRSINKLIVRERDPRRLVQQACELLVTNRGFKGAWIGLLGKDDAVASWAQAGFNQGFDRLANRFTDGNPPHCIAEVLSRNSGVMVLDPRVDCRACPLSSDYDTDQAVLTRLGYEGRTFGILAVSFPNQLTVDAEERALLGEVAADLAFALCDIELANQRDRYAQIVASSQEAMALIGPDYAYLEANAAYGRLVGSPPSALIGQSVASVVGAGPFVDCMRPSLEKCLAGHVVQIESAHATTCSPPKHCDAIFSPCFAADASIFAAALCIRDITQQKLAEVALQIERNNLSAFLSAAPAAILVLDRDHQVVHANGAAFELMYRPSEESLGGRCGELLGCVHRLANGRGCGSGAKCADCPLFRLTREALEDRRTVHDRDVAIELERDGATELRWFVANAAPITVQSGPGAVLAMHDVTERRQAEELLRLQAMLLESQNEASIDGIMIEDDHGKLLWSNRRFGELWSLPPDALRVGAEGASAEALLEQLKDGSKLRSQLDDLRSDVGAKSRDVLHLKDGRTFDCYSAPVIDPTSTRLGRLWLYRDVTAEKRLQASVAQSDRLASMGMLAAGVAHEINNPLSYILYNLESLVDDFDQYATESAKLHHALAKEIGQPRLVELLGSSLSVFEPTAIADIQLRFNDALAGTRKIKDIARGLGSFSRVEKDQLAPIDLRGAIESAINIAFNEIKYRAQIVKDLGATARILGSDGRLSQVFLNLLINAAHSIPDGDVDSNRICVRTWNEGDWVVAQVEDTGCGIPSEHLERIFDPFFTTKPAGIGSGLGLNIVRNIITGYGGTIEVSSTVGKGTMFVVRLPMATTWQIAPAPGPATERPAPSIRGRVLVVDDECAIRSVLRRVLRGHEVVEADSGEQARELLAEDQAFDVILCDMMMPRVSGIDLHKWLAEQHPRLARKVIFLTGGAFTQSARAYLEQVENMSIEKPFDSTNLLKMVTEWVRVARESATSDGSRSANRVPLDLTEPRRQCPR